MVKYSLENDPLCYEGSDVLINLLDIQDQNLLNEAEQALTEFAALQIDFELPPYDLKYFRTIHKALFQDVYSWAGELRHHNISKSDTHFCDVRYMESEANKIFSNLAEANYLTDIDLQSLIIKTAEFYGDLNMIHPFREGNGRAQRILFEHLIVNTGYEISWEGIKREEWNSANIAAVNCDYDELIRIFEKCIG